MIRESRVCFSWEEIRSLTWLHLLGENSFDPELAGLLPPALRLGLLSLQAQGLRCSPKPQWMSSPHLHVRGDLRVPRAPEQEQDRLSVLSAQATGLTVRVSLLQRETSTCRNPRPCSGRWDPLAASIPAHGSHTVPGFLPSPPTLITACTALSWATECIPCPGNRAFTVLGQPRIIICAAELPYVFIYFSHFPLFHWMPL